VLIWQELSSDDLWNTTQTSQLSEKKDV